MLLPLVSVQVNCVANHVTLLKNKHCRKDTKNEPIKKNTVTYFCSWFLFRIRVITCKNTRLFLALSSGVYLLNGKQISTAMFSWL